ncbi:uncharacterized protein B0T23DRAFT_93916 [Neurospora hispaniola]|uniref:Uncharacterized protein n=1 Tax=Neurospora hispaniola TaxID=588809 RepID=A0AAJ0IEK0_9PEZI|nr:hypothetical protein B0T23DRAFT_93916 [Neurospora hispaniola]
MSLVVFSATLSMDRPHWRAPCLVMARLVRRILLGRPSAQPDSVAQFSPTLVNRLSRTLGAAQPQARPVRHWEERSQVSPTARARPPESRQRATTGAQYGRTWGNISGNPAFI